MTTKDKLTYLALFFVSLGVTVWIRQAILH
jgi:hypothetical protein